MKKIALKLLFVCSILLCVSFNSCASFNIFTKGDQSLKGTWNGKYTWKCYENNYGNEKISFKIKTDKKGVITGTVSYLNSQHFIKGYKLIDAKLGEWSYTGGKLSKKGNNIIIDILEKKDSKFSLNTFSGELKNNSIIGITRNGEKCSSYKGPSGSFSIKK